MVLPLPDFTLSAINKVSTMYLCKNFISLNFNFIIFIIFRLFKANISQDTNTASPLALGERNIGLENSSETIHLQRKMHRTTKILINHPKNEKKAKPNAVKEFHLFIIVCCYDKLPGE